MLTRVDTTLCFSYSRELEDGWFESFIQPFKYLRDVENDHKIGENWESF